MLRALQLATLLPLLIVLSGKKAWCFGAPDNACASGTRGVWSRGHALPTTLRNALLWTGTTIVPTRCRSICYLLLLRETRGPHTCGGTRQQPFCSNYTYFICCHHTRHNQVGIALHNALWHVVGAQRSHQPDVDAPVGTLFARLLQKAQGPQRHSSIPQPCGHTAATIQIKLYVLYLSKPSSAVSNFPGLLSRVRTNQARGSGRVT